MKNNLKGISIVFEDNDLVVINKPAGLLTIGTNREKEKTAHFILNEYVKKGNPKSRNRVFVVHRLDKDTSGLLVFAKNEESKQFLQENWGNFSKKYRAVVEGKLPMKEVIVTTYLEENKALRVYSVKNSEQGKLAKTGFVVIQESSKNSLMDITLFTGRKHQIRVHLSEMGFPIVGDSLYGKPQKGIQNMALHSYFLAFTHPKTKQNVQFTAETPDFFIKLMQK